ncbi:antibiotic biosynthesis monooxygenase [Sandaracinobacter sp. RS1-74]|uniref:putative quinol monooxygenase n=1 Tax=Sandaracinobacteroides sayramensis TaxID=2913411 RepID=UPI001EDA24E0|nr:putative quinol monooxygenase [Sandaracinobacteroides sayramensis]MCG2842591.1 antibiotic biosynthesis monooxygenase [Sandaracinobacteroides sayramensis]
MITRRTMIAAAAVPVLGLHGRLAAQVTAPAHVFTLLPIRADAFATFLPVMQANARASRKEPGNIAFDVFQPEDDTPTLILFESWRSRAAHAEHMTLPHLKAVEAQASASLAGQPDTVWLIDVPGLPAFVHTPVPAAATTRNVIVRLKVKPHARPTFIKAFAEVIPQARAAPGNHLFDLHQEADDGNSFLLLERWASVASHEAHLGQPYSLKLDGIVPGTLAQPPERYLLRDVAA